MVAMWCYLIVGIAASAMGLFFSYSWKKLAPATLTRHYLSVTQKSVHTLISDLDAPFWQAYRTFLGASFHYIFRNLLALAVGIAPVALFFVFFLMDLPHCERGKIHTLRTESSQPLVALSLGEVPLVETDGGHLLLPDGAHVASDNLWVTVGRERLHLGSPYRSYLLLPQGSGAGWLYEMLGFQPVYYGKSATEILPEEGGLVVIRPWWQGWHSPTIYLNDLEILFYALMILCSLLGVFAFRQPNSAMAQESTIGDIDFLLANFAHSASDIFCVLGNLESRFLRAKLARHAIDRPLFLTGLARSGSTIILESIAKTPTVATHRYGDFPFLMTPVAWRRFANLFAAPQRPVERLHKDRIMITSESPEAFEEPLWQHFFPWVHKSNRTHILSRDDLTGEFSDFFRQHMQKILHLRGGERYLSKGNYNITRLDLLANLFPDARFLIPVRHPMTHVSSLVRQHRHFLKIAEGEGRMGDYLRAAGHYEFGPQRTPIRVDEAEGDEIERAWDSGDQVGGYALQWRSIYGHLRQQLKERPDLAARCMVIRYEDLCADPQGMFSRIADFTGLEEHMPVEQLAANIKQSSHGLERVPEVERKRIVEVITEDLYRHYYPEADDTP